MNLLEYIKRTMAFILLCHIFLTVQLGTQFAWVPIPRTSSKTTFQPTQSCIDWGELPSRNLIDNPIPLTPTDLTTALDHPLLRYQIFHLRIKNNHIYIVASPPACHTTTVCWRRSQFFIQHLDDVLSTTLHDFDLDILYWPWDEPFMTSFTWPIWQYNRETMVKTTQAFKQQPMTILLPYSYAFSYQELLDVRSSSVQQSNLRTQAVQERSSKVIFRGSMTYQLHLGWEKSARGKFCLMIDHQPSIADTVDFGIVGYGNLFDTVDWSHPNIGCARSVPNKSMKEQGKSYKYILDIEGQSGFTDRLPYLLSLDKTAILRQERVDSEDFLTPYVHANVHYVPVSNDLDDIVETVLTAEKNNSKHMEMVRASTLLVDERLTDHSILCAVHANLLVQEKVHFSSYAPSVGVGGGTKVSSNGIALVWERWQNGPRLIVVKTNDGVLCWTNVVLLVVVVVLCGGGKRNSDDNKKK